MYILYDCWLSIKYIKVQNYLTCVHSQKITMKKDVYATTNNNECQILTPNLVFNLIFLLSILLMKITLMPWLLNNVFVRILGGICCT